MDYPQIYISTPKDWRDWLQSNHQNEKGIWLVYYKKHTGKARVPYNEAVEEALCFGWIDSTIKRIDNERYMQKFTPRSPKSGWSVSNKKRVEKLVASGKMTEAGLKLVEAAKQNGKWEEVNDAVKNFVFSEAILSLLQSSLKAYAEYLSLSPSQQKQYTQWIMSAKKAETHERRMKEMICVLESGKKLKMM